MHRIIIFELYAQRGSTRSKTQTKGVELAVTEAIPTLRIQLNTTKKLCVEFYPYFLIRLNSSCKSMSSADTHGVIFRPLLSVALNYWGLNFHLVRFGKEKICCSRFLTISLEPMFAVLPVATGTFDVCLVSISREARKISHSSSYNVLFAVGDSFINHSLHNGCFVCACQEIWRTLWFGETVSGGEVVYALILVFDSASADVFGALSVVVKR